MRVITIGGKGYWGQKLTRVLGECGHTIVRDISLPERAEGELTKGGDTVDAVVIATPAENHARLIWKAMDLGLDVLVTKPLALQLNQALSIADRAQRSKLVVSVDSTFLHSEIYSYLKGLNGKLNYYQSLRMAYGPFHIITPPGWDLLPHDVAILLGLGMKVENINATQDQCNALMQVKFESGGNAWATVSRSYYTKVRTVVIGLEGFIPFVWKDDALWSMDDGDMTLVLRQQVEPLVNVVDDFARRCGNRELTGITDAKHGADVCSILHDAFGMPGVALGLDEV